VIVQILCRKPSISLFDRERLHSCIPSKIDTFGCRSFDLRRSLGRRPSASPWKEQLTAARLSWVGTAACLIITIVLGSISCSFVAVAVKSTLTGFAIAYNRWSSYVAEASRRFNLPAHWIRAVMQ
jgi:hypothetical protein